jgi:hypothetical protein
MPVTNVLHIIKSLGTVTTSDDLFNVVEFVPKANRYTAFWDQNDNFLIEADREYTSIDHILLSPELRPKVDFVDIPHNYDPRYMTDHFPVVVQLRFNGGAESATLLRNYLKTHDFADKASMDLN